MKTRKPNMMRRTLKLTALAAAALGVSGVHAAAFQLPSANAAAWGRAFGGGSLWTDDPSAAYNSPAAMAWLSGPVAQGSYIGIRPELQFHGTNSNILGEPQTGNPSPQGGGHLLHDTAAFYATPVNDRVSLGFSLTVPYGLTTKYNPTSALREFGTMTSLKSIAGSMSASFKLQDNFALGFGLSAQRTRAQLNNGLGIGDTVAGVLGTGQVDPLNVAQINVRVHDWSLAYFFGAEWKPSDNDSVDFNYHSRVVNTLHGQYKLYYPNDGKVSPTTGATIAVKQLIPLIPLLNQFFGANLPNLNADGSKASSDLNLPAFATIDYLHRFNDSFSLGASAEWTNWSTFKTLNLDSYGERLVSLQERYNNSWSFSVGGDYKIDPQWTIRGGLAYDETPISDATRDPRVPDNSRKIVAVGLGYQYSKNLGFDLAYEHQFVNDARIKMTAPLALGGGSIDGYSEDSGDVVSMSATYRF